MENINRNPMPREEVMPKFNLINCPRPIEGIANAIKKVMKLGTVTELCLSEHNRGAAPMIDSSLQDELPFEPPFNTSGR